MHYPHHLLKLIQVLKRFPGVGSKTAERFAFQLLDWPESHLQELSEALSSIKSKIQKCEECGCLKDEEKCFFCSSSNRDHSLLCIIASPRDVFSIEETNEYRGIYHVLGGLLSPLDRRGPDQLNFKGLKERLLKLGVQEVIIAIDSTLEGDATALYLRQELDSHGIKLTRLAFGLPMGSSLDYVDGGTLTRAFLGRSHF